MNNKTRILTALLVVVALACAGYCAYGTLSCKAAYAAPAPAPAAPPAAQQPGQPPAASKAPAAPAAPAAAKPVPRPAVVPHEPEEQHSGLPWMLVGIIVALIILAVGYKKSKVEDEFDRTKFLAFVFAAVAVVVVSYYGARYLTKEPPKEPKISIIMEAPNGAKAGQPGLAPRPAVIPAEPEKPKKGFPWMLVGIIIAGILSLVGYYKSKTEEGFDRTKFLGFVFAGLAVLVACFYGGKYISKEPEKAPKISITMGAPKARPAGQPSAPAPSAPSATAPGPYTPVIKVMEKGKEVQYGSPEDFLARTALSPAETSAFADRRLVEARKADDTARAKGDKAALERTSADLKAAEKLVELVRTSRFGSSGTKVMAYVSLGKRDPFMSPLEVPKVFPPIPPNAPPLERVPAESVSVKAIVWSAKGFRALVVAPDGRGYTVKLGDRIGNKGGRIVKISEKRVYVTEKIRDVLGDIENRDIVLKLYKEAE